MKFVDYVMRSEQLRFEQAWSSPRLFFMQELGRSASTLALVIVIADVTPMRLSFGDPWARVRFVALVSLVLAGWAMFRYRIRGDRQTPPPAA